MDYQQALSYLYSLGHEVMAAKYGLENIRLLLDALNHPERAFKSVIVAGTNGKGSTAAMLESVLRTAGHRTALFTSPHLMRLEERIRVAGQEISQADFARLATAIRAASEALVREGQLATLPTFFEQLTAIALQHFYEREIKLAILEIGVGGQADAVNVVERIAAVITPIDFDHQNLLGDTIAEITAIKAGVITPAIRVVIGRQPHEAALEVLMRRCLEAQALPVFANEPTNLTARDDGRIMFDYESGHTQYSRVTPGLRGRHQATNAVAAIQAAELLTELGFQIPRGAIIRGLRQVSWPGRLEVIEERPCLLLDGAHNRAGAKCLRAYLNEFSKNGVTLVFGAMRDKDLAGIAAELFGAADTIILTRLNDPRAASSAMLGRLALGSSRRIIFTDTVRQALSWARSMTSSAGLICVTGSLSLVGEIKRLLEDGDDAVSAGNS
jgi:dihydrofolate synthase/folylpolyglutamate synthase